MREYCGGIMSSQCPTLSLFICKFDTDTNGGFPQNSQKARVIS